MNNEVANDPSASTSVSVNEDAQLVPAPPFSLTLLAENPEFIEARLKFIKIMALRTVLMIMAIFAYFSIYWGALWKVPVRPLEGWIIDFDGSRIGSAVKDELLKQSDNRIAWQIHSTKGFSNANDVAAAVVEEECWVAVTINADASARLNATLLSGNDSYNSSEAITIIAVEARNENAYRTFIRPSVETSMQNIVHNFAVEIAAELQAQNNLTALLSVSPSTLVQPIYYTLDNVRPFDVPVQVHFRLVRVASSPLKAIHNRATAVSFVGLIYLLILSFYIVNSGSLARQVSGLERMLTFRSLIQLRLLTPLLLYLVISCFYALLSLAFKLPFERKFGRSGFVVYWMLSFCGMSAVGLALEALMPLLTAKFIQLFLMLWIISSVSFLHGGQFGNISTCLLPLDILPGLYAYGHAAPFYNISRAVRTIVFSTRNEVGKNFGVLVAWIVVSCLTMPLIQWYRRREQTIATLFLQSRSSDDAKDDCVRLSTTIPSTTTGMGFRFRKRKPQPSLDNPPANDNAPLTTTDDDDTTANAQRLKHNFGRKARQFFGLYWALRHGKADEDSSSSTGTSTDNRRRSAALIDMLQPRPPIPEISRPLRQRHYRDDYRPRRRDDTPTQSTSTLEHAATPHISEHPPRFASVVRSASPRYSTFARATHSTIIFAPNPVVNETSLDAAPPAYSPHHPTPSNSHL
ncbi:uncharacterized protein ARMOST_00922 [Armillaria ostoyae]|uniref:DUF3533 domain-containing protein n=1 Tax=Armillaria ostoyae TaxID=47428 RepID=A0A284QMJ5_ARMOS|nr:uncharacterized protein ARMOST_00922 [Armillaria ostoyae]